MKEIKIGLLQADIVYKALYYVARNEDIEVSEELTRVYEVLAEDNPMSTEACDVVEIMELLVGVIKDNDTYREYYGERLSDDE